MDQWFTFKDGSYEVEVALIDDKLFIKCGTDYDDGLAVLPKGKAKALAKTLLALLKETD